MKNLLTFVFVFFLAISVRAELVDRLGPDYEPQAERIAIHNFSAAMFLWAAGKVTRADVISAFTIIPAHEAQLDALKTHYLSLTANEKSAYHGLVESAGVWLEAGFLTIAQFKTIIGL